MLAEPLWSAGQVIGVLSLSSSHKRAFAPGDQLLARLLANCCTPPIERARLRRLAMTDDLTLAYNQRYLSPRVNEEIERARRSGQPLSVLLLDLDHFKNVNDEYGHEVGDTVLRLFADRVRSIVRRVDVFIRRGGEEFLLLMPATALEQARNTAERIRRNLSDAELDCGGGVRLRQTVSIGAACWDFKESPEALQRRADVAMYAAKEQGRDRVVDVRAAALAAARREIEKVLCRSSHPVVWPQRKQPSTDASEKTSFGKGVFRKCDGCGETLTAEALEQNFEVCPQCGQHHKLARRALARAPPRRRRARRVGRAPRAGRSARLHRRQALPRARRRAQQKSRARKEAIEIGRAAASRASPIAYGAFVFDFMGGSMGSVVGEKIARLFERGAAQRLPVVLLQASGGARMQEGILSLMQMAKTVAARERLRDAGLPFISVLLHPTTGGVAASFALPRRREHRRAARRSSASPARASSRRRSARSSPRASSAASSSSSTG